MPFLGLLFLKPSPEPLPSTQVSHHPPVSAFYVSNQKDGFCMSGSITAKSRFYGEEVKGVQGGVQSWSLQAWEGTSL